VHKFPRLLFALAASGLFFLIAALPATANDNTRYAAILIVADTGEVLHARHADQLRHPASLTKLMTLYLAFEDIRAGEIGLGDQMRVSANAASQPAVKLGLEEGETIRVLDALKAIIVRSANDAAVVLAERLDGDEEHFAQRMNTAAHTLGMTRTRFTNASGLPDTDQVTTVRDIARLANALRTDFPEYYALFQVRRFEWNDRVIGSHNAILDMVDGADGLKTGYIDASGYNLAASAMRDGVGLVAIVMGGPSARTRDAHTALLLERGFEALAERAEHGQIIAVADNSSANRRRLRIILDDDATVEDAAYGRTTPVYTEPLPPVVASPAPTPLPDATAAHDTGWRVQVGAFNDPTRAHARLAELRPIAAGPGTGVPPIQIVTPVEGVAPPMWRARLGGYADRASADAACARLQASGGACFVINEGD